MMETILEEHIGLMKNIRNHFGDANYEAILEHLRSREKTEFNESNKFLLNQEIEKYSLLVEREERLRNQDVNSVMSNKESIETNKTDGKPANKREFISIERNHTSYVVDNTQKHRILHCAFNICINLNETNFLTGKIYREIAVICNTTEDVVKSTLSRIVKNKEHALPVKEKQYYIMYLADKGITNIADSFSFLCYDTNQAHKKEKKSA